MGDFGVSAIIRQTPIRDNMLQERVIKLGILDEYITRPFLRRVVNQFQDNSTLLVHTSYSY